MSNAPLEADAYAPVVRVCLGERADGLRVAAVASATPRATTLRLESVDPDRPGAYAFKYVEPLPDALEAEFGYRRLTVENEVAVLDDLREYNGGLLVDSGSMPGRSWLRTRWLSGPSVGQGARQTRARFRDPNSRTAAKQELLALIYAVFKTVADLHERGYTHGDLQPAHFLIDGDRLALVDFGLARGPGALPVPYRGALVHFVSPEVAAGMRAKSEDIPYDTLAEVYSAGAVAFHVYTGNTATDYGAGPGTDKPPFAEMLARIEQGGEARRTFAAAEAPPFPELEGVLERCLARDRAARWPTIRAAADALKPLARAVSGDSRE